MNLKIRFSDAWIISESHDLKDSLTSLMSKELCRMSYQISLVEVHLKYEHDHRDGRHKKFCIIEAHLMGSEPITVTNEASCYAQAVNGAIIKLKTSYITRFGHMWNN